MKKLLDFYRNSEQYVNDAYDNVIVDINMKKQEMGYQSFIFCGCEPGVGATTLSISIAISMAVSGWKTVLIDGDMRKNARHKRLNTEAEAGLEEYLSKEESYEKIVYETNHNNLYYIPGGSGATNPISLLCANRMNELMEQLKMDYDYIIIDMPSIATSVDAKIVAKKVDYIVLVAAYGQTDLRSIRKAKKVLNRTGGNVMGIIVNKVGTSAYKRVMKNYDYFMNKKYITKKKRRKV
jgi:capsular exopolysaccharide synthesis family protein